MTSLRLKHLLAGLLLGLVACRQPVARKAINASENVFLKQSALRNKDRFAEEHKALKEAAENDGTHLYQQGSKGYYFAISSGKAQRTSPPEKGDWVEVDYQIENLDGTLIYAMEEIASEDFLVDQEDVLPALRVGVKHLRKGEVGVFLFPSYLCYGYQGDGDKIGVSQPLKMYIHLLDHQNK